MSKIFSLKLPFGSLISVAYGNGSTMVIMMVEAMSALWRLVDG